MAVAYVYYSIMFISFIQARLGTQLQQTLHALIHHLCMHDFTPGPCIYFLIGHRKYLGFLFLYSTYNNAVVHIFIRLLINSQTSSNYRSAEITTPESTTNEDISAHLDKIKKTDNDIELIEVQESVDSRNHSPGEHVLSKLHSPLAESPFSTS